MRETHRPLEMDVTFTNVLEGVRQYFQGLPTGSNETADINPRQQQLAVAATEPTGGSGAPAPSPQTGGTAPNYPAYDPQPPPTQPQYQAQGISTVTQDDRTNSYSWPDRERAQQQMSTDSRKSQIHSITNYPIQNSTSFVQSNAYPWSGHERSQVPKSHNERPQTAQAYWTQDVKIHERLQNHAQQQENQKIIQNHYPQQSSNNSYQYPRSHDQSMHQSYNHASVVHPNILHSQSSRTPSRTEVLMTNNHQPVKQPSTHTLNNHYSNGYPQKVSRSQDMPKNYPMVQTIQKTSIPSSETLAINGYSQNAYYPSHSKTQTPVVTATSSAGYQVASNQYHSYSQSQQNQYPSRSASEMYESKGDRRTHNLPPIAGITSANYHSKSTREGVTAKVNPPSSRPSYNPTSVASSAYSNQQSRPSAIYTHHSRTNSFTVEESSTSQNRYPATSEHYQYPVASSAYPSTSINSSSSKQIYQQSSYPQYFQKPIKVENQSQSQNTGSSHSHPQLPTQRLNESTPSSQHSQHQNVLEAIKKRESPLDLSVKTVRTIADSTAHTTLDEAEHEHQKSYRNRLDGKYIYQNVQAPLNGSYVVKDSHGQTIYQKTIPRPASVQTSAAPRVDFLPNFSASALQNQSNTNQAFQYSKTQEAYNQNRMQQEYYKNNHQLPNQQSNQMRHNSISGSTYQINRNDSKSDAQALPRFELPIDGNNYKKPSYPYPNMHDATRKRTASESMAPSIVPTKIPKVEAWREKIDQQIEQKLSTYENRIPDQIKQENYKTIPQFAKPNNHKTNMGQPPYYQQPPLYKPQMPIESHNNQNNQFANQQYSNSSQYDMYVMNPLHRSNSTSKLMSPKMNSTNNGGVNKTVLSILRNSLEIKGAKEAQKKLDQMKPMPGAHQSGIQYPSTDVTAPLQPKPSIHSRQNVSPFTAASLDRNSNTPPNYKFHCPRAVDSIKYETETIIKQEINPDKYSLDPNYGSDSHPVGANTNENLDGLAAFLAHRIRTKGERKQLTSSELLQLQQASEKLLNKTPIAEINLSGNSSSGGSPPKLYREQAVTPSRRKLFSKSEDEQNIPAPINGGSLSHRNTLRSSSETSVFDFRDSDSEGEMPVLEMQSLEDMRRDRKSLNRTNPTPLMNDSINNVVKNEEPEDPEWAEMCSKFCEQLVNNNMGKKKGKRRKKPVEPEPIKLEIEEKENHVDNKTPEEVVIKQEIIDEPEDKEVKEEQPPVILEKDIKKEIVEEEERLPEISKDEDYDSDVPLTDLQRSIKKEVRESDDDEPISRKKEKIGAKQKIDYSSESDSDTNKPGQIVTRSKKNETPKKDEKKKEKMTLRSADSSPVKSVTTVSHQQQLVTFLKKKALYGDGSDFRPGWEEELYQYKRSIRMPARLISVTKPHWHRMSTSLPDLDACSPAPSSITDDTDFSTSQRKLPTNSKQIKKELIDSDSNSSFSLQRNENDDKLKKGKNSIVDLLVERVGKLNKKRNKSKENKNGPKIIEKSSNLLLDTPSLGIKNKDEDKDKKKKGKPKPKEEEDEVDGENITNSVYLGYFRKKTVYNFREQFQKSCGNMVGEQFSTVVLKSRTRTETRVMKQRATIREVFGEDRPASAPPMTCHEDDLKQEKDIDEKSSNEKDKNDDNDKESKEDMKSVIRAGLRSAKTQVKKTYHVTRKYTFKNPPNSETNSIASTDEIVIKSETPSINGDETSDNSIVPTKRKYKLTKIRRKFSSGFDYIRKKKKTIKKEESEDGESKAKRRGFPTRQDPECEEDIAKEIKSWVLNKSVGETHLHRAARLGFPDVTAYCLEKMDHYPSPRDNAGYTPLHEACARGHLDIAILLLSYGANASESAQGGIRPLHEAAENGFVEIIRLLLSYGADPRLATYAGLTPLSLATDEDTKYILKNFIDDMEGRPTSPWIFKGPAACFDNDNSGYDAMLDAPSPPPESDESDFEMEISETPLPNLYTFKDEPQSDQWILLQDLSNILKVKSRDALLKQISPSSQNVQVNKTLVREMKFNDFVEKSICCTFLCAGEKINARSSKIALVRYTDKVIKLLGIEKFTVSAS